MPSSSRDRTLICGCDRQEVKSLMRSLLTVGGIFISSYLICPKTGEAVTFLGTTGDTANIAIVNPSGTDTVYTISDFYYSSLKRFYWSKNDPWNLQPGDTVDIFAYANGDTARTWKNVTLAFGHLVMPLFPGGYTIAVKNISNSDSLVVVKTWLEKMGSFSDTLTDTTYVTTDFYDYAKNINESDSVQVWANGNWDNLIGITFYINAKGLEHGGVGSTSGTIQREHIDGDIGNDINLISVEEWKVTKPNSLGGKIYPSITKDKVNVSGFKSVDVYDIVMFQAK